MRTELNSTVKVLALCMLTPLSSCQIGGELPLANDYAAWSTVNQDGTWTQATETAVTATSLPHQVPKDIEKFCPQYSTLGPISRAMFWTGLLAAMAEYESDFNPDLVFTEKLLDSNGDRGRSRGLLQISIESANQDRYGCAVEGANDLHDPQINLSCGARILATWVEADGVITSGVNSPAGGARYWSVLRASNQNMNRVSETTRSLGFCRTWMTRDNPD